MKSELICGNIYQYVGKYGTRRQTIQPFCHKVNRMWNDEQLKMKEVL